jgi:hypothetical protein
MYREIQSRIELMEMKSHQDKVRGVVSIRHSIFVIRHLAGLIALLLAAAGAFAQDASQPVNLLPNPSFEWVEPPVPTAQTASQPVKAETYLPRTWNISGQSGAEVTCPDDKAQAHTGSRCIKIKAAKNQQGVVRYYYMPIPRPLTLTVRFWARGEGQLGVECRQLLKDRWSEPTSQPPSAVSKDWKQYETKLEIKKPGQYVLDIDNPPAQPTEVWIDDVFVGYPGMPELPWPPTKAMTKDKDTLLLLDFEKWFNENLFFVKQKAGLSKEGEGVHGKCLQLGAEGYVACSANDNFDCRQGTIEVWFKMVASGADGLSHTLVTVPGPDGMWMGIDSYAHVGFSMSNGWRTVCGYEHLGNAWDWQPGVWRHMAACWDKDMLQVFVDGKLVVWEHNPKLPRFMGPELGIGSPNMELDDLRISKVVRYRQPVPPPQKDEKRP